MSQQEITEQQPKNNNLKLYKSEVKKIVAKALGTQLPTDADEPSNTFENHKEIKTVSYQSVEVKQSFKSESVTIQNGEVVNQVNVSAENASKKEKFENHESIEHQSGGNENNGNLDLYKLRVKRIVARALGIETPKEDSESSSDFENKNQIKSKSNDLKLKNENEPSEDNQTIMKVESSD